MFISIVGYYSLIYFIIDFQVTTQEDRSVLRNAQTHQNKVHGVFHKQTVVFRYLYTSGTLYDTFKKYQK